MVVATPTSGPAADVIDNLAIGPGTIFNALVVLVIAYLVSQTVSTLLKALADRFFANRFRVTLLIPVIQFVVYGVALWSVVVMLFEFSSTHLIAFSGLLGAAMGLGLQDLLADVVGGLVLVAERPYQIGDKVAIGEHYGEVVNIGIRSTQLLTSDDTLVSVPNYLFFNETIANANAGRAEMLVTVEFYIDPESNARAARSVVKDALISSQYVFVDTDYPVEVHLVDELHYRTVTGKAYVNDLRNEFRFKTDVTDRVLKEFARQGIRSPRVAAGVENEDGE